ncbi:MAG: hypothetical protein ABUK01_08770 [Leptospirales bacterium]
MKQLFTISIFLFCFLFTQELLPVSKKKVLVMTFKNIEDKKSYEYLEPSITDTVSARLKKEFVFSLFDEKEWKTLAKKNFFFEDSFHTPTIGMQLGLLGKQDIVIGGGYIIRGNKIITKVFILGIAKREILKEFEIVGYADNRIWTTVTKIANTIATIAKDVLPNDNEWSSIAISGKNQISLTGGLVPIAFPAARTAPLPSNEAFSVNPNDFPLIWAFSVDYSRFGVWLDNFIIWGNFTYGLGSTEFAAEGHNPSLSTVGGTLSFYHATVGVGYRFLSKKSFYLSGRLGTGYYISTTTLDFSTLSNPPSSLDGAKDLSNIQSSSTGVSTNLDFLIGYQLLPWMTVEIKSQYQHIFFKDYDFGQIGFSLITGFKF